MRSTHEPEECIYLFQHCPQVTSHFRHIVQSRKRCVSRELSHMSRVMDYWIGKLFGHHAPRQDLWRWWLPWPWRTKKFAPFIPHDWFGRGHFAHQSRVARLLCAIFFVVACIGLRLLIHLMAKTNSTRTRNESIWVCCGMHWWRRRERALVFGMIWISYVQMIESGDQRTAYNFYTISINAHIWFKKIIQIICF